MRYQKDACEYLFFVSFFKCYFKGHKRIFLKLLHWLNKETENKTITKRKKNKTKQIIKNKTKQKNQHKK